MSISCTNSCKTLLGRLVLLRAGTAHVLQCTLGFRFSQKLRIRLSLASFLIMPILAYYPAYAQTLLNVPQSTVPSLPVDLMENGQPIDPLCFESVSADEWVDVNVCGQDKITKIQAPQMDAWAQGKIGYSYRYKEDSSDAVSYSYYQYVGQLNGSPAIVSYSSGGGTGQFTSLIAIERRAGKIRVLQGFGAGDRCNGGISDAKIDGGVLHYGQNMTPIDFLQMAEDNIHDLQPYDDLEASAASCFGVARFENGKFTGVSLLDIPQDPQGLDVTYKHQDCFSRLFREWLSKGKKDLSAEELKEFTGEFNRVCLEDNQPAAATQ
jgi:hypothetical protein